MNLAVGCFVNGKFGNVSVLFALEYLPCPIETPSTIGDDGNNTSGYLEDQR
jgi:hypothetical protein